jgi:hypothetical protein
MTANLGTARRIPRKPKISPATSTYAISTTSTSLEAIPVGSFDGIL